MYRFFLSSFFFFVSSFTNAQRAKLILPIGHTDEINSSQFSPDGKQVLTASNDFTAKIWDVESGNLIADLKGHTFFVNSARFSPDGKQVVTVGQDGKMILWDTVTGDSIYSITPSSWVVSYAEFSPNGKLIVVASDNMAVIWDVKNKQTLHLLESHQAVIRSARFSTDGKRIVTASEDKTAMVWDVHTGKALLTLKHSFALRDSQFDSSGKIIVSTANYSNIVSIWNATTGTLLSELIHPETVNNASFNPDGTRVVTSCWDKYARIWDTKTGKMVNQLEEHTNIVNSAYYNRDGKRIATTDGNYVVTWNSASGEIEKSYEIPFDLNRAKESIFSPDGKRILVTCGNFSVKIVGLINDTLISDLSGYTYSINSARFSPDGSKVVTTCDDNSSYIWDIASGKIEQTIQGHESYVRSASFCEDGKKVITTSWDQKAAIWEVSNGKLLKTYAHDVYLNDGAFSPDGKKIATVSNEGKISVWSTETDSILFSFSDGKSRLGYVQFSSDGSTILTNWSSGNGLKLWDGYSGRLIFDFNSIVKTIEAGSFSFDGRKIIASTNSYPSRIIIFNSETGQLTDSLEGHASNIKHIRLSPDESKIITDSWENSICIIDRASGQLLHKLKGHSNRIVSLQVSRDGKYILSAAEDNTCKLWDMKAGKLLYTFFSLNETQYLAVDSLNRYDGSEEARKLLYFTCGTEIILLDQVKDQLWVPNLAERIMKGDSINAKTIDQLDICGLTPWVEEMNDLKDAYHFKILPRRGGLGETVLYINGIEVTRFKKTQLQNKNGTHELIIKKQELTNYFIPGQENPVTVKAWTADNTISSRGLIIKEDKSDINGTAPNLYTVLVGVSDYKGDELDLKYAAKDATYMSAAISNASRKLLNTDGNEHVFTYNLTTSNDRYLLPEKNSIKKTLEEIGKKASANDILLIFFAGHGVMEGKDKKQFYFLTADASKSSAIDAIADVGISTNELTEWIKPANIKAQKRILIFDACNSGQAIRDFVKLGNPDQGYVAARSDEKGQQIKAIEKLNNQSGLIILAASASDQNAYEMGRYSQGLLTYSLLKVMKQQPEILENGKYLDVSNWLNAAKKMVSTLAEGTGARQEPQLNSNNNFNIGLIDEEVRDKIILAAEKPLFARSNFQNTDTKIDNLKFRSAIDKELMSISSRGINADITYSADYEGADAFALTGDYKINGDTVTVNVLLVKGGTEVRHSYEAKGKITELNSLISNITSRALDWLKNNK